MRKATESASKNIRKDIKRAARKQDSSEERIWIVFDGARGEADQALRRRDDEVVTALR